VAPGQSFRIGDKESENGYSYGGELTVPPFAVGFRSAKTQRRKIDVYLTPINGTVTITQSRDPASPKEEETAPHVTIDRPSDGPLYIQFDVSARESGGSRETGSEFQAGPSAGEPGGVYQGRNHSTSTSDPAHSLVDDARSLKTFRIEAPINNHVKPELGNHLTKDQIYALPVIGEPDETVDAKLRAWADRVQARHDLYETYMLRDPGYRETLVETDAAYREAARKHLDGLEKVANAAQRVRSENQDALARAAAAEPPSLFFPPLKPEPKLPTFHYDH
jgi:hypothetical protein